MKLPVGEEFNKLGHNAALAIFEGKLENKDEFLDTIRNDAGIQRVFQLFEAHKDYAAFFATAYFGGFHAGVELEHAAHTNDELAELQNYTQNQVNPN